MTEYRKGYGYGEFGLNIQKVLQNRSQKQNNAQKFLLLYPNTDPAIANFLDNFLFTSYRARSAMAATQS